MTTTQIRSAHDIAFELEKERQTIKEHQAIERTLTDALLNALHREKKNDAGNYQISKTSTLKVADSGKAMKWCLKHGYVKPDTTAVKAFLRRQFENPEKFGFKVAESERIIPKGSTEDEL